MIPLFEVFPTVDNLLLAGLLGVSLLTFNITRKSLRIQAEEQIYSKIIDTRIRLENNETFTRMARESPEFLERLNSVSTPEEYYNIMAFLDLLEFLQRLNKKKMIDPNLWPRWKALGETIMSIPKFRRVWAKTKHLHSHQFVDFIDSLQ